MSESQGKLKLQRLVNSRLELFESRIKEGWTYKMLVDDLAEGGIEIKVKYFERCMNIARKRKASSEAVGEPIQTKTASGANKEVRAIKGGSAKKFELKQLGEDELF